MFKGIVKQDSLYDADEAGAEFQMSWVPHAKLCQQHLSEQKYELFSVSETPLRVIHGVASLSAQTEQSRFDDKSVT